MAELREDVARAREAMTIVFGARREIRKLDEYLHDNETVEGMVAGMYIENEGDSKQKEEGRGLLVLTSKRVIFVKDGVLSRTSHDFIFTKIDSVEWHSGLMMGEMIIISTDAKVGIHGVWRSDGKRLADDLRKRLGGGGGPETPTIPATTATFSLQDRERIPHALATSVPMQGRFAEGAGWSRPALTADELSDMMKHLERLGQLKERGLLTDDEFESAKARILS